VNVASLRPGVAENRTAFEAMATIYKYLQTKHKHDFRIVVSETDSFSDPELTVSSVPTKAWKPTVPHTPVFLRRRQYRRHLDPVIQWADIVLTLDPTIFHQGALVIERCRKNGTPVLFDASKTIADTDPHWYLFREKIERAVSRSSGIIATVPKVLERYRELGLLAAMDLSSFTIMGHPVDTMRFSPDRDHGSKSDTPLEIISLSRLVPEKGIYYILEALDPLVRDGEVELSFLGDGPMESLIRAEARQRGICDGVNLIGTVPHKDVPEILCSADIFINHAVATGTWEEYFGAANLEAMSCGLPCVITDCGGISYAIRERNVVKFVRQRDVAALRTAVEELVADPDYRRELGNAARDYVTRNYATDVIGDRFERMLTETIK
jgi:glycosyltransferase involved in cell wall biosynthesis